MKVFNFIFPQSSTVEQAQLTTEYMGQLQELATTYRRTEKFDEAIHVYETLIGHLEGPNKIFPSLLEAKCFLETRQIKIANKICSEVLSMIESCVDEDELKKLADGLDSAMRDLAEEFLEETYDCETALILGRARLLLISSCYEGIDLLIKLERIGLQMQNIAEKLSMQGKRARFKSSYKTLSTLLDEIFENMLDVSGIGIEVKCTRVAWYLKYFGFCCDEMGDFQKSKLIYGQAISILRTVFGDEAKYYRVLGHCYNNLAYVLQTTGHKIDAIIALRKAMDVFELAVDWPTDEEKTKCISKTSAALYEIKLKLESEN